MQKLLKYKRGSVIILWAFLLPFILGVTGVVIDIGVAYVNRTKLQHVADAAALAGAAKFKSEKFTDPATITAMEDEAKAYSEKYVKENISGSVIFTQDPKIEITKPKNKAERMNVDLHQASPTYFLKIFDFKQINVSVHAAATGVNQPSIFNYALITTDTAPWQLFGGGAPANTVYQGDIYTNSSQLSINGNSGTKVDANRLLGNVFCNSSLPNDFSPYNNHLEYKFHSDRVEPIDTSYDPITNKNKNKEVQEKIDELLAQTTKTYSSGVNDANYQFPENCIYVKGDFNITPSYMGGSNTFIDAAKKGKMVIVADGDINLTSVGTLPPNVDVTLCSLKGDIIYNGGVDGGSHFNCLAPLGNVTTNSGSLDINGYIICNSYTVGASGYINHINISDSGRTMRSILTLVE